MFLDSHYPGLQTMDEVRSAKKLLSAKNVDDVILMEMLFKQGGSNCTEEVKQLMVYRERPCSDTRGDHKLHIAGKKHD